MTNKLAQMELTQRKAERLAKLEAVAKAAKKVSETYKITCPPDSIYICFEHLADSLKALEEVTSEDK